MRHRHCPIAPALMMGTVFSGNSMSKEKHKPRQDELEAPLKGEHEPEASPKQRGVLPPEIGGPKGPEPTRYGDWEVKGRCSDF
jgi:hypothetical protein